MSRDFRGLAFRAGRNDTPFLYAQKMQQQGIENKRLQEKRRQEQMDADQKWMQELINTDFKAIDIIEDNIVQKRGRELMDNATQAYRNIDGIINTEAKNQLESQKFDLEQDYNFLQSTNAKYKDVIKETIGGVNRKYYNQESTASALKNIYQQEIVTPDGSINRNFNPDKLYETVNSYQNLNVPNIVSDAVSNLTQTINEEVQLAGGLKKEVLMKYNSFTKLKKDKNGNDTFAIDENGNVEVDASPELVSFLSNNKLMKTAIDGKREELIAERGGDVTRKEALDALLKEVNPTERKVAVSGDPRITSSAPKESLNFSIVTDDDIAFADADRAIETGVAGYKSIYVDLPQGITESINLNTTNLEGEPTEGRYKFVKMGSDGQGREYIEVAKYQTAGEVSFEKIPFNEKNVNLIRNNISKSKNRESFDKMVNDLQSQFQNKKQIGVSQESFNTASNAFKQIIESTDSDSLLKMFERYGVDVSSIDVDEGSFFTGNSGRFYLEGKGIKGTKWSDNPEDMMEIAKMLYNKNPNKFISEFKSVNSTKPVFDPNDPL